MIPISSFIRPSGALSPNMLKLFKKSINILNSVPVTSSKLYNDQNMLPSISEMTNHI
uniref:Apoptosis inhibitor 5-like n=1 Tax=Rhizophora mucronata TaxID=61149 RepID=A0A2P2LAH9_RHIMU